MKNIRNSINYIALISLFVILPLKPLFAAKKVCVKADGSVVVKKRCKTKKNEQKLNLDTISTLSKGEKGEKGERGDAGPQGVQGIQGQDGPLVDTLPSALTLRGVYSIFSQASSANSYRLAPVSFGLQLESAPIAHYLPIGSSSTTECPGDALMPEAAPGHLCVYEAEEFNSNKVGVTTTDANAVATISNGENAASKFGFSVYTFSTGPGSISARGTWAVTAP